MKFVVYRYTDAPDNFLVTDEAHRGTVKHDAGADDRELEEIGIYDEMGEERAAFNETLAKDSIKTQGFYRFEAKTWNPVAQSPATMPV